MAGRRPGHGLGLVSDLLAIEIDGPEADVALLAHLGTVPLVLPGARPWNAVEEQQAERTIASAYAAPREASRS